MGSILLCKQIADREGQFAQDGAHVVLGHGLQSGAGFGDGDCIRINAALPHSLVREAMGRLEKYVFVG